MQFLKNINSKQMLTWCKYNVIKYNNQNFYNLMNNLTESE